MGIIENLGIKPINSIVCTDTGWHSDWCDEDDVREVEQQKNDLLEALIEDILEAEKNWLENWLDAPDCDPLTTDEEILQKCHKANVKKISIIEKACYPKSWEEIKELI
jgi:hypothetical protein